MAEPPFERTLPSTVPALGAQPDLSDMQTAFAEANYQLELLHLLQQKAERSEQVGNRVAIASFAIAIGTGLATMSIQFLDWRTALSDKAGLELAQICAIIIGLLATIIVIRVQVARDRQQLLLVEVNRLSSAIAAAHSEVKGRGGLSSGVN
jgi:hypothetical protein